MTFEIKMANGKTEVFETADGMHDFYHRMKAKPKIKQKKKTVPKKKTHLVRQKKDKK